MAFYDLMTYQQIIKSMDKMNEKRENEVNLDWVVVVHDTRFMHQLCLTLRATKRLTWGHSLHCIERFLWMIQIWFDSLHLKLGLDKIKRYFFQPMYILFRPISHLVCLLRELIYEIYMLSC